MKYYGYKELHEIQEKKEQKAKPEPEVVVNKNDELLTTTCYPPLVDGGIHQEEKNQENVNHQTLKPDRKTDRHAKSKTLVGVRIKNETLEKIKEFCASRKLTSQEFFELAADQLLAKVVNHQSELVVNMLTHDDLMIYKTLDDIIMLYKKLTNRKWTTADDRAGAKFNTVDRRLIEIGMIHTFIQAKGKRINSFAYFIPEIQTMIDLHMNNSQLDVYLRARRERLAKWMEKLEKKENNKDDAKLVGKK